MAVDQKPAITQLGEVVGINKSDPTIDGGLQIIGTGTIATNHLSSSHLLIGTDTNGMGLDQNEIRTTGTNLHIGTLSSHYIVFTTNKSNRMNISSAGNINIGDGTNAATEKLQVTGNFKIVGNNSAFSNFTSGYVGGAGWRINYDGSNSNLEVDNIMVRNTLQTHIFQKDTIKATNGQLYISDSGVVVATGSNTVTFNSSSATFNHNDVVQVKDINPTTGEIQSVSFLINDPSGPDYDGDGNATYDVIGDLDGIVIGATGVRTSGGTLVLDASSPNSPFMDVLSGSTMVVRTGNLAGITSTAFGSLATKGFGFYASGSAFLEGGINAINGLIGGWSIDSDSISKNNIKLDSTTGYLKIGTVTSVDDTSNSGLFAENDGDLLISQGTSDYIKFKDNALELKATSFRLDTPNLDINSDAKIIDIGNAIQLSGSSTGQITIGSNITLKGSGTSTIAGDMEIAGWEIQNNRIYSGDVGSLYRLDLRSDNGSIRAWKYDDTSYLASMGRLYYKNAFQGFGFAFTEDYNNTAVDPIFRVGTDGNNIAGWAFTDTQIKTGSLSNGGMVIQNSPTNQISVRTGSSSDTTRAIFGEASAGVYGIFGYTLGGVNKIFELSNNEQQIAGFTFTETEIAKNNITMSNAGGGKLTLNNGTTFLSGSGEGQFANGGIQFDKDGNVIITGSVTIGADVTVNADVAIGSMPNLPPDNKLYGHWNFESDTIIDVTGRNPGVATWDSAPTFWSGSGAVAGRAIKMNTTEHDIRVPMSDDLKAVLASQNFTWTAWVTINGEGNWNDLITFNMNYSTGSQPATASTWRLEHSNDTSTHHGYWFGTYVATGSRPSVNTTVNIPHGETHFVVAECNKDANIMRIYIDAVEAKKDTGDLFGVMTSISDLRFFNNTHQTNDVLDEFRIYTGSLSQNEIDALFLNPAGNRGTTISGDQIKTGLIESNNWSTTAGSQLDLTNGTIKLGGSTSPKFSVTNTGEVSASAGHIGGWDIDSQAIYSQSDTHHLYLASDGTKISTGNYSVKPVIDIANTGASDFRLSMGATLYKQKENQGILIQNDYTSDNRLFEVSVHKDAPNVNSFTASIAGWDFDNERLAKGNVTMSSEDERIKLGTVTDFTNDDSAKKGILMGKDSSDYEFFVGQEGTEYLFWDGNNLHIKTDNLDISAQDIEINTTDFDLNATTLSMSSDNGGRLTLGSSEQIMLSGSGEGHLSDGNISFDRFGNLDITNARLKISSGVGQAGFPFDAHNSALGKFVDTLPSQGNLKFVAFEDDTIIARTDKTGSVVETYLLNAGDVGSDSGSRQEGDIYDANKPFYVLNDSGFPLPSLAATGREFTFRITRDNPPVMQFYSPFGDADIGIFSGSNGIFETSEANIIASQSQVTSHEGFNIAADNSQYYYITSSLPIVMTKYSGNNGGSASDRTLVPPVSREILFYGIAGNVAETTSSQTVLENSRIYYYSDKPFSVHTSGDGDGTDAEMGIPIEMLGDTYAIPDSISDYRITSVEPTTVKVSFLKNNNKTLYATYVMSSSKSVPQLISVGDVGGGDTDLALSDSWLFEGTAPFFLRTNISTDEMPILGYRKHQLPQYQGATTIDGDKIRTGIIKSNNFNTTDGSEYNLNDGTFRLGGSVNPDLQYDGTTLVVSGTLSSSIGNIGGWTLGQATITGGSTILRSTGQITCANLVANQAGNIANWEISQSSLQTGDDYTGIKLRSDEGIIVKGATSHSIQTFEGFFSFGVAHHSVGPGTGGQEVNQNDGTVMSQGGGGMNYDDPPPSN